MLSIIAINKVYFVYIMYKFMILVLTFQNLVDKIITKENTCIKFEKRSRISASLFKMKYMYYRKENKLGIGE